MDENVKHLEIILRISISIYLNRLVFIVPFMDNSIFYFGIVYPSSTFSNLNISEAN